MVEDDDLVERVGEGETLTKNPEKAFLRHLVNQVQAAGAVDSGSLGNRKIGKYMVCMV